MTRRRSWSTTPTESARSAATGGVRWSIWGCGARRSTPIRPATDWALYVCGTLSKAIGGFGGVLPGSLALLDRVRQTSHYYEGASAPMSAAAGATAKALEIVLRQPQLRQRLDQNVRRLRGGLRALGLAVDDWPTPIIGLSIGNGENMRRIHDELRLAGIIVPYFAAYSAAGPAGRLRIAVFATHTEEMLDRLLAELRKVL